jgi:hypothetical protein
MTVGRLFFWSHRLPIARAARKAGFELVVVVRVDKHRERIENEGFKLIHIGLKRSGRNIVKEWGTIRDLVRIDRDEKSNIVHHVAVKPFVYGSVATILRRGFYKMVLAITMIFQLMMIFCMISMRPLLPKKAQIVNP